MSGWSEFPKPYPSVPPGGNFSASPRLPKQLNHDLPLNPNNNARFAISNPQSVFPTPQGNTDQESIPRTLGTYSEPPNSAYNPPIEHPVRIEPRPIQDPPGANANPNDHLYYNVQGNFQPTLTTPPLPPRQPSQPPQHPEYPPVSYRESASPTPPSVAERAKFNESICVGCICFKYESLKLATNNFDQNKYIAGGSLLGEGGFGPVYLGHICATKVAIKVLQIAGDRKVYKGDEQFKTEISVLTRYRHPNLLTLMGYSDDGPTRCIVYEFMSNGTLEDWLEGKMSQSLNWQLRQCILMDTARGLLYLHAADPEHPLIHRDVKTANVLLDASMQAKVGDFGLARQTDINIPKKTGTILGTSGYIPPEYYRGEISVKTDIFAFGVVILEVLTGLPSFDGQNDPKELVSRLRRMIEKDYRQMIRWIDKLSGNWPTGAFVDISQLAWSCLERTPDSRPFMFKVLQRLLEVHEASKVEAAHNTRYSH